MPFQIIRNDILNVKADAIVNPTDISLSGSGSIDKMIHEACGPLLNEEIKDNNSLKISEVLVTKSYDLKICKYIIHAVGPRYVDGKQNEFELLRACYRNILNTAVEKGIESVAIPLISTGTFSFPKRDAFNIAHEEITSFLDEHSLNVKLVVYDEESFGVSKELSKKVKDYINERLGTICLNTRSNYYEPGVAYFPNSIINACESKPKPKKSASVVKEKFKPSKAKENVSESVEIIHKCKSKLPFELDESFSESLFRIIDTKGLKDPQVYRKAGIDRKLFSSIRSNKNYHPSKRTAVQLCIALELDIEETNDLLKKAGLALSGADTFDAIIEYFIKNCNYDLFDINSLLLEYDQPTIGC